MLSPSFPRWLLGSRWHCGEQGRGWLADPHLRSAGSSVIHVLKELVECKSKAFCFPSLGAHPPVVGL